MRWGLRPSRDPWPSTAPGLPPCFWPLSTSSRPDGHLHPGLHTLKDAITHHFGAHPSVPASAPSPPLLTDPPPTSGLLGLAQNPPVLHPPCACLGSGSQEWPGESHRPPASPTHLPSSPSSAPSTKQLLAEMSSGCLGHRRSGRALVCSHHKNSHFRQEILRDVRSRTFTSF